MIKKNPSVFLYKMDLFERFMAKKREFDTFKKGTKEAADLQRALFSKFVIRHL